MGLARVADAAAIRPAATVVLTRLGAAGPEILMGQRGHCAAFMPSKYVFPGGAVDVGDAAIPLATPLPKGCTARLQAMGAPLPETLAVAAIREVFEETGLALGIAGDWKAPEGWHGFVARGLQPAAAGLQFMFRAITPPGRSRRFDARFFLADVTAIAGDVDDFSAASDELSHLHWIALTEARSLDLPFITEVVLAEVGRMLREGPDPAGVPFFDNSGDTPRFRRLV